MVARLLWKIQNFVSFKENQSSEYLSFYNSLCTFRFEISTKYAKGKVHVI